MKLRVRLTLMSSVMLSIACVVLTLAANYSADKAITTAIPLIPTQESNITMTELEPAQELSTQQYEVFRFESILAMIFVVVFGSAATYFVVGKALTPLNTLTEEMKKKTINNLDEKISEPNIKDEIYDISTAFNEMIYNLQKSFTLQEQFSADVAHELRTPLAVMMAKIDVFKLSTHCNQEEVTKMTDELNIQVNRLTNLTNDLLCFSKELPLKENSKVDLHLLITDLIEELSEQSKTRNTSIRIEGNCASVHGEDRLLERVFFNLLENAIKYSSDNSCVLVKLAQKGNQTIVQLIDTGDGIPDSEKELVFQPFYRTDKSRNLSIGGNGLGLAICKKILNRHLACIEIKDNEPKGSIFEITFDS